MPENIVADHLARIEIDDRDRALYLDLRRQLAAQAEQAADGPSSIHWPRLGRVHAHLRPDRHPPANHGPSRPARSPDPDALARLCEPQQGPDLTFDEDLLLPAELHPPHDHRATTQERVRSSWTPIDLVALNLQPPEPPTISGLVYPGRRHVFSGEPESLKSWAALVLAVDEIRSGRSAAFIDFSEGGRRDVYARAHDLGLSDNEIRASFLYLEPEDAATTPAASADIAALLRERQPSLIVFDATTGALELHGLDPNSGRDIQTFYRTVLAVFLASNAAIVLIDHLTRNRDARGKFAIGSERKIAAADVHLRFETVVPFGRGRTGRAKIETLKDRPGYLPRPRCAELELTSDRNTGRVTWSLTPATCDPDDANAHRFWPTVLMERVSTYVESCAEPPSRNNVETAVRGKATAVRVAIDTLIREGHFHEKAGARGARLLVLDKPYREADGTTSSSHVVPTSSRTKSSAPRPTSSRPLLEDDEDEDEVAPREHAHLVPEDEAERVRTDHAGNA